jgi:hypothetical protein
MPSKATLRFTLRTLLLVVISVSAVLAYLLQPGHLVAGRVNVAMRVDRFEYVEFIDATGANEVRSRDLFAVVRATNIGRNTLWYRGGGRELPHVLRPSLKGDKWQWQATQIGVPQEFGLRKGETLRFHAQVDEDAKAMKVGVAFASKWFGTFDNVVLTDEFDVQRAIDDMNEQELAAKDHRPTERGSRESAAAETPTSPLNPDASASGRLCTTDECHLAGQQAAPPPR